jgi:hypothetical protein
MRLLRLAAAAGLLLSCIADSNLTESANSQRILQEDFRPPKVFQNVNLVRNTNLDKGYVRETINVVIENVDEQPQSEYYLPFEYEVMGKIGGLEARDKKNLEKGKFQIEAANIPAVLGEDGTFITYDSQIHVFHYPSAYFCQVNTILRYPFPRTTPTEGTDHPCNLLPRSFIPETSSSHHQTRGQAIPHILLLSVCAFSLSYIEAKDQGQVPHDRCP